jgi:tetratricopeptide (TPR) repeat protein
MLSKLRAGLAWLGRLPFELLSAFIELAVTRRGLAWIFLAAAAVLAVSGWLHPPLTPDVRGIHLPVGVGQPGGQFADKLLYAPRHLAPDSVGVLLLCLIGFGGLLVLWRPNLLGLAASLLLVAAVATNLMTILNHPALIERLDYEHDQRFQLVGMLEQSEDSVLTTTGNGRVSGPPVQDGHRADMARGWYYLQYGYWLILLAALGVGIGSGGPVRARLGQVALWALFGLGVGAAASFPRLSAEYHWARAKILETRGDPVGSRAALDRAVALFPELAGLERTWLLTGKLDFYEGKASVPQRYFRGHQLAFAKEQPLAKAVLEDLEAQGAGQEEAVRRELARILTNTALTDYRQSQTVPEDRWRSGNPYFSVPGFYPPRLVGAQDAWHEGLDLVPVPRSNLYFYLGETEAHNSRGRPELSKAQFGPMLDRLADRVLRADILSTIGDAYFQADQHEEARKNYEASVKAFMLPKIINYRGQKGLGGM